MPKFQFPLDRLLRLRMQQERSAEAELLRARVALDAARAKVNDLRRRLAELSEELTKCVGRTVAGSVFGSHTERTIRMEQAIVAAGQVVTAAEAAYRAADRKWKDLASEVEAMETLREKQREEFRLEELKKEQQQVDEAGLRRWMVMAAEPE